MLKHMQDDAAKTCDMLGKEACMSSADVGMGPRILLLVVK